MHLNNKGSILLTTLIIFSIIITITMMCIGLCYTHHSIFYLEYKEAHMKEDGYGAIEVVHSNVIQQVTYVLENIGDKDSFNDYLLSNEFINKIKDISKTRLSNVEIQIPNGVQIDETSKNIKFNIVSVVKEDVYTKRYKVSVSVENPFSNQTNQKLQGINTSKQQINQNSYIRNEKDLIIEEIVKVYDYKEI